MIVKFSIFGKNNEKHNFRFCRSSPVVVLIGPNFNQKKKQIDRNFDKIIEISIFFIEITIILLKFR